MKTGMIEIEGYKLTYRIEGVGPTAIVLGNTTYYERSMPKALQKTLRMVFIDYRGFAEGPEVPGSLSFEMLLDDIERCRVKLGLKKCIIIGHSVQGIVALEYAKKYKNQVSHVVMIGTPPHMRQENRAMAQRNWDESVCPERKAAYERNVKRMPDAELDKLPPDKRFFQMNFRNIPKSWYDYNFDSSALWQGVKPNTKVLEQMHKKLVPEIDVSEGLESFDRPVLLAYGRFDFQVAPVQSWDPLRPKFKHLTVRIFEKSAHSPHYEEPKLFTAELTAWLEKFFTNY